MADASRIIIATRGSALALAQANMVRAHCLTAFPDLQFELKILKTTGDKLQAFAPTESPDQLPKGLFTKELEAALLLGEADLAVHSLKDLPTDLPEGLTLAAVSQRADVRDLLLYRAVRSSAPASDASPALRGLPPNSTLQDFPPGATIATSSTRRVAQLLELRPDLKTQPIRGNVGTRLRKLSEQAAFDGIILAAAGLQRLHYQITGDGRLEAPVGPEETRPSPSDEPLLAVHLPVELMLPCVGQAAIGIEARAQDERLDAVCASLNHPETFGCVTAERAFLRAMGGGCLSPVAAYACLNEGELWLRAVSFRDGPARRGEIRGPMGESASLGERLAGALGLPTLNSSLPLLTSHSPLTTGR